MRLNTNFYDEKYDVYLNYEEDLYKKQIVEILEKAKDCNYDSLFDETTYSKTINKLSSINCNNIKWYKFGNDSKVLDLSNNFGVTTNFLYNKVKEVTCVIPSKVVAQNVARIFDEYENVEIINANLCNIDFSCKFDYIIFSDDLKKYLPYYGNISGLLKKLESLLTDNGKILFAVNNCFGIKYISGASYDNTDRTLYNKGNEYELPSRNELKIALEKANISNYTFYYPLPDFNCTNVIFSDKYLPNPSMSKLMYNINYTEGSRIILNELEVLKEITKKNEFKHFANSYLIEIVKDKEYKNDVKFVSFNNLRKEQYRIITKMYDEYVEKTSYRKTSETHIKRIANNIEFLEKVGFNLLDKYNEDANSIISKYVSSDSLNLNILNKFNEKKINEAITDIKNWYEYIYSLLIVDKAEDISENIFIAANVKIDEEKVNKLHFIKNGVIDLVFENAFYIDNKYYIYDQEWNYKNAPIEFILYRAINNLYSYDFNLENIIPKEELLKEFGIFDFVNEFNELERYIQNDILDEARLRFFNKSYGYKIEFEKVFNDFFYLTDEMNKVIELKDKLFVQKQGYEKEIEELNNRLNSIYNSKSWKFIEKIRKIRGKN